MRRFAFPRALRLRKRREFLAVQDGPAIRVRSASFLLLAQRSAGESTRFGVVASRRLGGAVVRNRAKRLLRELFRLHRHELPAGLHLVAIAHGAIRGRTLRDLERELGRAGRDLTRLAASNPASGVASGPARR